MKNSAVERDYELIKKTNEGDTSAFGELVLRYKDVSLSLACSILKDPMLAEDVLQEVFVRVYQRLHTFKFNAKFTTWLYRIVVNISYNELKKRRDNTIPVDEVSYVMVIDGDAMAESDQKKYINCALQKLRADEALILRLFYLSELRIKEIEEVTGFKASKIKVDLFRGRENLHHHLKKLLGNDLKHLL